MTAVVAGRVIAELVERGQTLAVAESLTGGQLASVLTGVPGASGAFRAGVVAYATDLKHVLLGVDQQTLDQHGAVSADTCTQMATGVAVRCSADWGIATTGVAGPDRQEGHPAGTVFVAVTGPHGSTVQPLTLAGARAEIQRQAVAAVLDLLLDLLLDRPQG